MRLFHSRPPAAASLLMTLVNVPQDSTLMFIPTRYAMLEECFPRPGSCGGTRTL
jgi:hypothetical protein